MTKPKRWPTEALGTLEDVKAMLLDIDVLAQRTQEGTKDPAIVMLQTDVRIKSREAFNRLTLARAGIYGEPR